MKILFVVALAVVLLSFTPATAQPAYDWNVIGVHVTVVEGTYVPNQVTFQSDANGGASCPAGTWLTYKATQGTDAQTQQANVKAVYALLLAAKLSGNTVNLFGKNAGCIVNFVHLQ